AVAVRDRVLALAEEVSHPYTFAVVWAFSANVDHDRGDADSALEVSAKAIALTTRQRLLYWLGPVNCSHGWALLKNGEVETGIAEIQQGLGLIQLIGVRTVYPYYSSFLAEGHLATGAVDEGLAVVDEGLQACETLLDCFYESEFHRLRGELLRVKGEPGESERSFRRGIEVARRQNARSLELRGVMSLAWLLNDQGRAGTAKRELQDVYGWFTEGLESGDLRQAREFLSAIG